MIGISASGLVETKRDLNEINNKRDQQQDKSINNKKNKINEKSSNRREKFKQERSNFQREALNYAPWGAETMSLEFFSQA